MSLRLEMLQVARLATVALGEEASGLVTAFVQSCGHPDGGFVDRAGRPDLYYTTFAVDALSALQADLPASLPAFLDRHDPDTLDFVHLCCLARLHSVVARRPPVLAAILERIESFRTPDGGYGQRPGASRGSAYACLLAFGAYADHGLPAADPDGLAACLDSLRTPGGGWANEVDLPIGGAPPTAAAVTLSRNLSLPIPEDTVGFLLSCLHASGGFVAFRGAPMPDLLSTAVALHALDGLQEPLDRLREPCLDFVDTLWTAEGGFHGNWSDDTLDVEYTYYGLLALGHLSL